MQLVLEKRTERSNAIALVSPLIATTVSAAFRHSPAPRGSSMSR